MADEDCRLRNAGGRIWNRLSTPGTPKYSLLLESWRELDMTGSKHASWTCA